MASISSRVRTNAAPTMSTSLQTNFSKCPQALRLWFMFCLLVVQFDRHPHTSTSLRQYAVHRRAADVQAPQFGQIVERADAPSHNQSLPDDALLYQRRPDGVTHACRKHTGLLQ